MGKGGYNGGSSLLSFSWFGWGTGSTKSDNSGKPVTSRKIKKPLAEQKFAAQRKQKVVQTEEPRLTKTRQSEKAGCKKSIVHPKVRAGHGDPEVIAKRLSKHMTGVEVRRITKNTLRIRKAEAVTEPEHNVPEPTRRRTRPTGSEPS